MSEISLARSKYTSQSRKRKNTDASLPASNDGQIETGDVDENTPPPPVYNSINLQSTNTSMSNSAISITPINASNQTQITNAKVIKLGSGNNQSTILYTHKLATSQQQ